jgi:hypothetical protein
LFNLSKRAFVAILKLLFWNKNDARRRKRKREMWERGRDRDKAEPERN